LSAVHTLVVAGDIVSRDLASCWAHGRRLISVYGPTEGTVCATMHECNPEESGEPPIGRPIANTRVYILDGMGSRCRQAFVGELYIGGAGIARGYLNRPELRRSAFSRIGLSEMWQARMYRTGGSGGDGSPTGRLSLWGGMISQVKIRGFGLSWERLKRGWLSMPGCERCGDGAGRHGWRQALVAYYTCREKQRVGCRRYGGGGVAHSSGGKLARAHDPGGVCTTGEAAR